MIDIHCHILPGVDDGAKSWDMALEMCRLAQQDGIQHIVATPHANDAYAYRREYLLACLEELRRRVGDPLTFSLGCDFRLSYANVEDALAHPRRYTIGQGSYLLVEFSDYGMISTLPSRRQRRRFEDSITWLVAGGGFEPPTFGL